jgi:programmed cell death protein 5
MSEYEAAQPPKEEDEKKKLREQVMRLFLTSEARQRLNNVRIVKPEIANFVEEQIMQLINSGKLKRQLNDDEVKEILSNIAGKERREFKIRWI